VFCPLTTVLFQIYLAGNKNSQQNMQHFCKRPLLFEELALEKQTSIRAKEERD
jgi:hypothetical protein